MNSNISTAELVKKHILDNPFLINYLKKDLINITQLARELFPKIKKENKKATIESISIAIKRLNLSKHENTNSKLNEVVKNIQIILRTELTLFCLEKNASLPNSNDFKTDEIFYLNQGANENTIILDTKNSSAIEQTPILKKENLASISLKDTAQDKNTTYRTTPGFVYLFLSAISQAGINIEDMISTKSQFTFIVEEKYALKIVEICQKIKKKNLI